VSALGVMRARRRGRNRRGCEAATGPTTVLACGAGSYENSDGYCISVPSSSGFAGGGFGIVGGGTPAEATAVCEDGDYSYGTHSGTCARHGGVSQWLTS
jgi:uncharacterized protein DUF3761